MNQLVENGTAYPCFCTEKRLNLLRKEALKLGQIPKYDNRCRKMSKDEVHKRLKRNEKHCIRFKVSYNHLYCLYIYFKIAVVRLRDIR